MTDVADKTELTPLFARPGEAAPHDLYRLGDEEMLPETAYQLVHDEAMLDGNARLNLATFVGTFMDEQADKLYSESFDKNMIDKDEYRATAAIEARCCLLYTSANGDTPNRTHPSKDHEDQHVHRHLVLEERRIDVADQSRGQHAAETAARRSHREGHDLSLIHI